MNPSNQTIFTAWYLAGKHFCANQMKMSDREIVFSNHYLEYMDFMLDECFKRRGHRFIRFRDPEMKQQAKQYVYGIIDDPPIRN
jgi:hypothetical protein